MEYRLGDTAPFLAVPRPGGRPVLPLAVDVSDTSIHLVEVLVPIQDGVHVRKILGGAPWLRVRENGRGIFRLLIRPGEAGGSGRYLAALKLGGHTLGLLLQVGAEAPRPGPMDSRAAPAPPAPEASAAVSPPDSSPGSLPSGSRDGSRRRPIGGRYALGAALVALAILPPFLASVNRPPPTHGQLRVICTWDPSFPTSQNWPPASLHLRHTVAGTWTDQEIAVQALRSGKGVPRAFAMVENVPLGAGQVEVACSRDDPDFCSQSVPFDLSHAAIPLWGPPAQELELHVQPAPSVSVKTQPGARIRLTGEGGWVAEDTADGDGRCELRGFLRPDQRYTLAAACPPDYAEARRSLSIRAGARSELELPLERVAGRLECAVAWDTEFPRPRVWPQNLVLKGKLDGRVVTLPLQGAGGELRHVPFGSGSLEVVQPAELCSDRIQISLDAAQPVRRLAVTVRPAPRVVVTAEPSKAQIKIFSTRGGELLGKGQGRCEVVLRPGQRFSALASCPGYLEARRGREAQVGENRIHLTLERPQVASAGDPAGADEGPRWEGGPPRTHRPPEVRRSTTGGGGENDNSIWDRTSGEGLH
ncbi:MAG: hypothetical protein HY319_31250 [Armatimonadetes bacterium]|nr:hypothetical protein [Armatimonadota bacterium]